MKKSGEQTINRKTKCYLPRAAAILAQSEAGLRKKIERGQVPYRRDGKRIFFFEEELYGLMDAAPGVSLEHVLQKH